MNAAHVKALGQYLTPVWAAEAIVEHFYADLSAKDVVVEPTCGEGAFLGAIPREIEAIGIEIDPILADRARLNTRRRIITGDFCAVPLDVSPTLILGNPPFELDVVDKILERSHSMLPEGGRVGFILPAYAFQTCGRVAEYAENWSITQDMLPRNIYQSLSKPLIFARFVKDKRRQLFGFALYFEATDVQKLPKVYRDYITAGGGSVWVKALVEVFRNLGGAASLNEIYSEFEGKKPTQTKFWREQIRKVLRQYSSLFVPVGAGEYKIAA